MNGVIIKMWLEQSTGLCVKILENEGRVIFLADSSLAKEIKRFNMDDYILTKTNISIADISSVDYMKVRAKINPIGLIVTPESLNVPGQKFEGVVKENFIEGVFEIEHPRYDGINAPAFPPNFSEYPDLAEYLNPSKLIESDDPKIVAKALELTQGASNSWEAMQQLSSWVASEIAYSIPGGGSAKGILETRAGECGGHSVLLAAFCRSLGIPARMVWGVIYTPMGGGVFGQHGWNEIYMGDAGWVPVDATAHEIDYVNSGHIRLGAYESLATRANSKEYEILDYRVAGVTPEMEEAAVIKYQTYLGQYEIPGLEKKFEIRVQDGSLVFELPENITLAVHEPDENGRWQCKASADIYLTFDINDAGEVSATNFHQLTLLPKKSGADVMDDGTPPKFRPFLGEYLHPTTQNLISISQKNDQLRMNISLEKKTYPLNSQNQDGGWVTDNNLYTAYFGLNEGGDVVSLTIGQGGHIYSFEMRVS